MANISQKNGVFHVRFRFAGKQYKKSLKTSSGPDAEVATALVQRTIHWLATGQLQVPLGVEAGDFIVSGGTLKEPQRKLSPAPTLRSLIYEYLSQQGHKANTSLCTERVHLHHLQKSLAAKLDRPCDQIVFANLDHYLQQRLRKRAMATVKK